MIIVEYKLPSPNSYGETQPLLLKLYYKSRTCVQKLVFPSNPSDGPSCEVG